MRKGWEIKRLEDVCDKASSNIALNKIENDNGDYPIYGASGFLKNVSFYHHEKPYIGIIKDGAGVGRITLLEAYSSVIGTLQYLIPNEDIDIRYFHYFLLGIDFSKYVNGSTIPHIYFKDYKEEPFLYIPLSEQQIIVSILDEVFAAIDQAKENLQRNLQNAKEFFQSELSNIFTTKGTDWVERKIEDVAKVVNGFSFKSNDFSPNNKIKSVKITNVGVKEFVEETDNYLPEPFSKTYSDYSVQEGNIVIALTRTIISSGLKVAVVPESYDGALINQRVAALVPDAKIVNQRFLYNFLCTDKVTNYVKANVNTLMQPNLSINDLKKMPINLPSLQSQKKIVLQLDKLSIETKNLETIYQQKLNNLEELKKSILQKAFSGELSSPERALSVNDGHSPSKKKVSSIKSPEGA